MAKKVYDDDDGHTIADMSGIQRQPLFLPRLPARRRPGAPAQPEPERDRPHEQLDLTPEERRWYILGALKACLLIALAFIAGLGLIVLLFYLFA
ncbi:MAG: hypothetical protein HDT38_02335 [Clostridiales bacterium]|nr:hypothetical protein [Clostridiales bacterium]